MALRRLQRFQSFELLAVEHAENAGKPLRLRGIDGADARVRVGAQERRAVREAGQIGQVLDVFRLARNLLFKIEARLGRPVLPALRFHFNEPFALFIARQSFSGVSGTLCMRTPTASSTALHTAGATARMPPSPIPFAPYGPRPPPSSKMIVSKFLGR